MFALLLLPLVLTAPKPQILPLLPDEVHELAYVPQTVNHAAREREARAILAKGKLTLADQKRLKMLGDDAFEPTLLATRAAWRAYQAAGKKDASYPLFSKASDYGRALMELGSRKRVPELIKAFEGVDRKMEGRWVYLSIIVRYGDPKTIFPVVLRAAQEEKTPGFEMYESVSYIARSYVMASTDPRATAFKIKILADPKADPTMRQEAYWHVAGMGTPEAIATVLKERHSRVLLRPLAARVLDGYYAGGEMGGAKHKVLAQRKDASGKTWGLLQSGVLGSGGDLWLVAQQDGKWTHPLFTGLTLDGISRWVKPQPPEPKFGGKTAKELAAGGWFDVLVGNAELAKDSDGDGLTDIEERRLGTDPNKADTDGDGDPDGVDPCPTSPNRPLAEDEQVLAAVFEARYHFMNDEGAVAFEGFPGMKPFELPGRRGPTVWFTEQPESRFVHPLEWCYEQGVGIVRCFSESASEEKPLALSWNKNHTEATTIIAISYGGLNATGYKAVVRKFDGQWIVISMGMAFVS